MRPLYRTPAVLNEVVLSKARPTLQETEDANGGGVNSAPPVHVIWDRVKNMAGIGSLGLALLFAYTNYSNRTATNIQRVDTNAASIASLQAKVDAEQHQLDQAASIQEKLNAIAAQQKDTSQNVHDIAEDLHNFESRFIVVANAPPAPRLR